MRNLLGLIAVGLLACGGAEKDSSSTAATAIAAPAGAQVLIWGWAAPAGQRVTVAYEKDVSGVLSGATSIPDAMGAPNGSNWILVGSPTPFCGLRFTMTRGSSLFHNGVWVYLNSGKVLVPTDETEGMTHSGDVTWGSHPEWKTGEQIGTHLSNKSLYWATFTSANWQFSGEVEVQQIQLLGC